MDCTPIEFMNTLSRPAGLAAYVNKVSDVLDSSDYFPKKIAVDRLELGHLVCPLFAVQYEMGDKGKLLSSVKQFVLLWQLTDAFQ